MTDLKILTQRMAWAKAILNKTGNNVFIESRTIVQTPWSSVVAINKGDEIVYLKSMPERIALEAKIIQILRDQFQACVPIVIASNDELHCFLMKDAGQSLRSILKQKFDEALLCKAIDQFTRLQLTVADHIDVFLDIGVPDWRLDKLADLYKKLLAQKDWLIEDGLSEKELDELDNLFPMMSDLCEQLSQYSIKPSIVQPDFNDNNTLIERRSNTITLIDLGEMAISHPFFSLHNCLYQMKKHYQLTEKDALFLRIKEACLKNYMNFESRKNVLKAFDIAYILWFIYGVLAYDRLIQACGKQSLMAFPLQHGKLSESLRELLSKV